MCLNYVKRFPKNKSFSSISNCKRFALQWNCVRIVHNLLFGSKSYYSYFFYYFNLEFWFNFIVDTRTNHYELVSFQSSLQSKQYFFYNLQQVFIYKNVRALPVRLKLPYLLDFHFSSIVRILKGTNRSWLV